MKKRPSTSGLDKLADQANFAEISDSRISGDRTLKDVITRPGDTHYGKTYYRWKDVPSRDKPWADLDVLTFTSPYDPTTANLYEVNEQLLGFAIRHQKPIILGQDVDPKYSGRDAVRRLNAYARK